MAQDRCSSLVRVGDPRGVVAQRDAAVAVAGAASDSSQVNASGQQLGRGIVTQGVQVRIDAEAIGQPPEPLTHRTRVAQPGSVRRGGEDEGGWVEAFADHGESLLALGQVLAEELDGGVVE